MVTFSSNDSADSLNKKFKLNNKVDSHTAVIPREGYQNEDRTEIHTCGACGGSLEYNRIDDSYWCNTCVIYVDVKNVKRSVSYDIPQSTENIVPDIVSIDFDFNKKVEIDHTPQPRGVLARMQEKGLKITSYTETDGNGAPITRRKYDDDE